ncbi:hypothetical protein T484DRAFT_1756262 [Baffinella frigidus]|nr:hypothetical protein T484DRAFT_1756262 [Cryptophyta sp. CCMP2293]
MTSPFNKSRSQRYEASHEAHEMGQEESRPLQSAMAEEWETVLKQRAVASLGAARSARGRSVRVAERSARLRAKLGVIEPVPQFVPVQGRWKRLSRPEDSEEGGSSDDELLVRSVRSRVEVHEEDSDEVFVGSVFDGDSEVGSGSCDSSDCGSGPEAEEECELSSEEESDEESGSEDEVIYMGRESVSTLALRQSLMSQFYSRT